MNKILKLTIISLTTECKTDFTLGQEFIITSKGSPFKSLSKIKTRL